jgi:hypothetical protein
MSDNYQAIYDAVRSRISGGNIGEVVREAAHQAFDISHSQAMVRDQFMAVTWEMQRPAVLFRPSVYADGSQWCALYGDDIMSGVCGFGETPEAAMADFDKHWHALRTPHAIRAAKEMTVLDQYIS